MLRIALVFPPFASPTYVPLGIAQLAAVLRGRHGDTAVVCHDLSLAAWERIAAASPEGQRFAAFVRGQSGAVFEEQRYRAEMASWPALSLAAGAFGARCRRWLETDQRDEELDAELDALLAPVRASGAARVGFSLLYPQQLVPALALARRLAELGWEGALSRGPRILFGGASLMALDARELLAACPWVDALVLGEGEGALLALAEEGAVGALPGLLLRDTPPRAQRPASWPALEELGPPDFRDLDLGGYFSPQLVLPALASRGCRWRRCRFCAHNASFGAYRRRDAARLVDELAALQARHGARHVYFADQFLEPALLGDLADEVLGRGLELRFHAMARPSGDYHPALLDRLAAAGCRWLSWGLESGSQRLLDLSSKGTRVDVAERVIRRAAQAGISNLLLMLFGLPGGGEEDLEQTFALLERLRPVADATTTSAFVLFDGTAFARRAAHFGLEPGEREVLVAPAGRPIHSTRRFFRERGPEGEWVAPRGGDEVRAWQRIVPWLGPESLFQDLWAEHYLLYATQRFDEVRGRQGDDPPRPLAPQRPRRPRRVA